jgi:hypothetical protein
MENGSTRKAKQPDLFSIHALVEERGSNGAIMYAQDVSFAKEADDPPSPLDVLAGRSGRRIVDAASATLTREIEGGSEVGYSYSAWCLAGQRARAGGGLAHQNGLRPASRAARGPGQGRR